MKMPNLKGLGSVIKTFAMANRPEILLGAAITATVGSTVLAAKGGWDARGLVVEKENPTYDLQSPPAMPLTAKEKAMLTWHCYIPATIAATTAIGSTAGLHLVHVKDKKALATAGMAALEEIKSEMRQLENSDPMLEAKADADGKVIVENTDHELEELYLVRDGRSGRDIWSNETRINEALNQVNNWINKNGDCELNSFYGAAGYELLFPEGDDWGWSGDHVELVWKNTTRDDGRPVRQFDFRKKPKEGFCK